MTILNRERYPYIVTQIPGVQRPSGIEYRDTAFVWAARNFNDGNDYWYCEIFHGDAFAVFDINTIIPPNILHRIKTDQKTFLYICNSHEAFLDIVKPLYETLVFKENIPPNKIVISNEAADLHIEVKKYADSKNVGYMQVEWILEFEAAMGIESVAQRLPQVSVLDENRTYTKRFLNFNRRWRLHRPAIVALMKALNILDKGYVSLGDSDDNENWQKVFPYIKNHHASHPELSSLYQNAEQEIMNLPPLYLDFTDLKTNRPHIEPETKYLYDETLFSVVNETTFYTDWWFNSARFLSEKTFKPVAYGHPFILVSVPNSLTLFRELGYKSFHPFIDESYDTELNDFERLLKIGKEIKRLSEMNDEQVKEFIRNVKPIAEFNQKVLVSKTQDRRTMHQHITHKTL